MVPICNCEVNCSILMLISQYLEPFKTQNAMSKYLKPQFPWHCPNTQNFTSISLYIRVVLYYSKYHTGMQEPHRFLNRRSRKYRNQFMAKSMLIIQILLRQTLSGRFKTGTGEIQSSYAQGLYNWLNIH